MSTSVKGDWDGTGDQEHSPITQVQLAQAGWESPASEEAAWPAVDRPRRPGFFARLCGCCGESETEPADAAPSSRTVYVPAAPHSGPPFIPALQERDAGRKTLVLDLDETLVHSSFKPVANPDYVIPVEIDGKVRRGPQSQLCHRQTAVTWGGTRSDASRLRSHRSRTSTC